MIEVRNLLALAIVLPPSLAIAIYTHLYGYERIYRKLYAFRHSLVAVARRFVKPRKRIRATTLVLKLVVILLLSIALAEPYIIEKKIVPLSTREVSEIELRVRPPLVLVIDTSGSMKGYKLDVAKEAITKFVENLTNLDIGIVEFSHVIKQVIPPTSDREKVLESIQAMKASGGTMYSYALETTLTLLKPYRELNITCFVVFVTDGLPGDRQEYRELLKEFKRLGIPIYTVFVGNSIEGIEETKFIAEQTGGKQYTASNVEKLAERLSSISRDIEKTLKRIEVEMQVTKEIEVRYSIATYLLLAALATYVLLRMAIHRISGVSF